MGNILNIYDRTTGKYVGIPSIQGESAYEIAVRYGYKGTEAEWLESLSSGETNKYYMWADESDYLREHYLVDQVTTENFDMPELDTYKGGTRLYVQPTPIIEGETDFYYLPTVYAGEKEYGYETDDVYDSEGKFYIDNYNSWNEDYRHVLLENTKAGKLEDYAFRKVNKDVKREFDLAKVLYLDESRDINYWRLTDTYWGQHGTVSSMARVWLYPATDFEPMVNGEYKGVTLTLSADRAEVDMAMVNETDLYKLADEQYGLQTFEKISHKDPTTAIHSISTEGYENGYVMVRYWDSQNIGDAKDEDDSCYGLDPFIIFTVHSTAYDYVQYKVWTTNIDGTESSPRYVLNLSKPLKFGEYLRFSRETLYNKKYRRIADVDENVSLYGREYFTGEYDDENNPIFKMTLYLEAPEKSTTTTINRYTNYANHNIKGLIRFYEITPTWTRTLNPKPMAYTGNCFALDDSSKNHGVYQIPSTGLDSTYMSFNYLQVYPTETTIVADRGCNVWCYDCVVVLRYTRTLTEKDYVKYNF